MTAAALWHNARLRAILVTVAALFLSFGFMAAVAAEDRRGHRTLGIADPLIAALRVVGRNLEGLAKQVLAEPSSGALAAILVAMASLALAALRRYRPSTWLRDVCQACVGPLMMASMFLFLRGSLLPAAASGTLAGLALLACGERAPSREASPLLVLLPIGIGLVLRFYALAEIPNGYAQHAAVGNVDLSLNYLQSLKDSLASGGLQPFMGTAWKAIAYGRAGIFPFIGMAGLGLFGVSLVVTRILPAALGVLSIYIAYELGKQLHSTRLGLGFAFLLAVSPWHITMSRYGTAELIISPVQFLLAVLFVVKALNGARMRDILAAAAFVSLSWYVYAANFVVPLIVGMLLMYRLVLHPRLSRSMWARTSIGVLAFVLLSWISLKPIFQHGVLLPNVRTGYEQSGSIFANWDRHWEMLGAEADQLFVHAADPWFDMPAAGLGTVQSALLAPGLVLAAAELRKRHPRDLAILLLAGLMITLLPAILAPNASFRRLMLFATLVALLSSFVLLRLLEAARALAVPFGLMAAGVAVGALLLTASGTFAYVDRVAPPEELTNAWRRTFAEQVSALMKNSPVIGVVALRNETFDANRYLRLTAYETLRAAELHGVPLETLYVLTTCEDLSETAPSIPLQSTHPPLVLASWVVDPRQTACGEDVLSRLSARYPGSQIIVTEPFPILRPDLVPSPR